MSRLALIFCGLCVALSAFADCKRNLARRKQDVGVPLMSSIFRATLFRLVLLRYRNVNRAFGWKMTEKQFVDGLTSGLSAALIEYLLETKQYRYIVPIFGGVALRRRNKSRERTREGELLWCLQVELVGGNFFP
jgi:hypothetical protein